MSSRGRENRFAQVVGLGRGALPADTVLSPFPTEAARADLESYMEGLRKREFTRTLALLSEQRALISSRPLLGELAMEFCRYLVGQSALRFDDAVRHCLDLTGIYPKLSDHLLMLTERRNSGGAVERRSLHVWPQGHTVGPLNCLPHSGQTVCGLRVTGPAWQRVARGSWSVENPALGWELCSQCDASCPSPLRYVLDESSRYIPFGAEHYRKLLAAVTKQAVRHLQTGSLSTVEDAAALADGAYRKVLLPGAVAYAAGRGEPLMQWALEARTWHRLRREHGPHDLHPYVTAADWKQLLASRLPHQDGDALTVPDDAHLKALRGQLEALIDQRALTVDGPAEP